MNQNAALIATAIVRPGKEEAFSAWQAKHDTVIAGFPGYVSSDILKRSSKAGCNLPNAEKSLAT